MADPLHEMMVTTEVDRLRRSMKAKAKKPRDIRAEVDDEPNALKKAMSE